VGKLDTNRMANSTKLSRVDDAHVALENDLGEIFGIPDNTEIAAPVFGVNPDGGVPVQPDGSIRGVPKFIAAVPAAAPGNALGFQFEDGTKTKKIAYVESELRIYEQDSAGVWTQIANLEVPGSGSGKLQNLSDVDDTGIAAGKVLAVAAGGTSFELVDPAAGSGKSRFADLSDTPGAYNGTVFDPAKVGYLVYIKDANNLDFVAAPAGLGAPFVMHLRAPTVGSVSTLDGSGTWRDAYEWEYVTYNDDGGFLTDNAALLTNDGGDANKFITLDSGVYNVQVWWNTDTPLKYGVREWRIVPTTPANADGPAIYGANNPASLYLNSSTCQLEGLQGIQHLGSKQLLVLQDAEPVKFQVRSTAGNIQTGLTYFATISKVK
jgi:hypothetical protein